MPTITLTPNLQLQLPSYDLSNWHVPMIYDLQVLDALLSGHQALTQLLVSLGISFGAANDAGIWRLGPGRLALGNGTPGDASAQVHAGSFYGDGSNLTNVLTIKANNVSIGNASTLNFNGMTVALSGSQINVTPSGGTSTPVVRTVTASTAMANSDYALLVDATSGPLSITLPTSPQAPTVKVKKIDATANAVTVSAVDGTPTNVLAFRGDALEAIFDGTHWNLF